MTPVLSTNRFRITASLLLAAFVAAAPAFADHPEGQLPNVDDQGVFNIQLENDLWGGGSDRHYTHGTRISYLTKENPTGFEETVKNKINEWLPDLILPHANRIGFVLGQSIFTPENIAATELQERDRPYAGWMYGGVSLISKWEEGGDYFDNLEINIGVVGPSALGEDTQTFVHRLKEVQLPNGWDNQLNDELGFVLFFERKWRFDSKASFLGLSADFTPNLGMALGNVYTYGAAGGIIRLGIDLPNDYGPPGIKPGLSGSDFFEPSKNFGWYVFSGIEGRVVGRNIFLDGNTFEDSHSVDKKFLVGDLQVGIVITLWESMRLAYTNVFRSREFDGQEGLDQFGSLHFSVRW
ncbi:MAG: lipid A deacylase LpxR family protein [Nitrospinaceae bacterium]|nr:MAG: lipid A deacylase LpxR family protein [Nitrospinaceae bacterium]